MFSQGSRADLIRSILSKLTRAQVNGLANEGFRTVVFNPRGVGIPQVSTNIFDLAKTVEDFDVFIEHIKAKYPDSNKYLIGFSLGGSQAFKYLASYENAKEIKGVVTIGNPFNVYEAAVSANRPKHIIYGNFLTQKLVQRVEFNIDSINRIKEQRNIDFDLSSVRRSLITFDFDKHFTFKFVDTRCSEQYYLQFSCIDHVSKVNNPGLIINSKNDPISQYPNKPRPRSHRGAV